MVRKLDVMILVVSIILSFLSILGIHMTKTNTIDYSKEMSEDCSFGGGLCKKTESNPYIVIENSYICKRHILEIQTKNNLRTPNLQGATKFKEAESIRTNLFDHLKFYTMMENTMIVVPIFQVVATLIYLAIFIYHLCTNTPKQIDHNPSFKIFNLFETGALLVLLGSVFGLGVTEVDFGDCLLSDSPHWMLWNSIFAKCIYWIMVSGLFVVFLGVIIMLSSELCGNKTHGNCERDVGGVFAIFGGFVLFLDALVAGVIYFILWFTAGHSVHHVWGVYIICAGIAGIIIERINARAQREIEDKSPDHFHKIGGDAHESEEEIEKKDRHQEEKYEQGHRPGAPYEQRPRGQHEGYEQRPRHYDQRPQYENRPQYDQRPRYDQRAEGQREGRGQYVPRPRGQYERPQYAPRYDQRPPYDYGSGGQRYDYSQNS